MFWSSIYRWNQFKYSEIFAWYFAINTVLIALYFFAGAAIFQIIIKLLKKFAPQQNTKESAKGLLNINDNNDSVRVPNSSKWQSTVISILNWLSRLANFIAIIFVSWTPSSLSGFGIIPIWLSVLLTLFVYLFAIAIYFSCVFPERKVKVDDNSDKTRPLMERIRIGYKKHPLMFTSSLCLSLMFAIIFPMGSSNGCVDFYSSDFGVPIMDAEGDTIYSNRFIRSFTLNQACPPGPPCHVYATLPEDASTSVFLNVHTAIDIQNITIFYDTQANFNATGKLNNSAPSFGYAIDDIESKGQRTAHSVLITDLDPNTYYTYQIFYDNQTQYTGVYKSFPNQNQMGNLKIAMGGDVGTREYSQNMTANLSLENPDLILIGGDSAYDNAIHGCWYNWDLFLGMFDSLNQALGRTVPLIISVGNHDIGFNAYQNAVVDPDNYPYYLYYFPQHQKTDDSGNLVPVVPPVEERRTYFYQMIGNSILVSLDSGYVEIYNGTQMEFLDNLTSNNPSYNYFAVYHVPTYSACLNPTDDPDWVIEVANSTWVPFFQQNKFKAVFENHVHMFKKTYPLTDGEIDYENGIIYFGDGNWGIDPDTCEGQVSGNITGNFEAISSINHVWMLNLNSTMFEIYPVNISGLQFYNSTFRNLN